MTVIDRIRAHGGERPRHPALVIDDARGPTTVTYAELVEAFEAIAVRLRRDGAVAGERCGLVARQGRGFIEAALGILAADLCMVPIPDAATAAARERHAREARLARIVAEDDGFASQAVDLGALDSDVEAQLAALRPAYLRFTSGTTYRHRGVVIGHDAILARLAAANEALEITPDDRIVWVLPMAHHFVVSILLYLRFGATILLPAGPLAAHVLGLADRAHATVLYASPYHYGLLASDESPARLDGVRLAVSTADGLRGATAEAFVRRFDRPLVQALGIIEVGLPLMNRHNAATKPTALGRALPAYDVWLRGDDGRPVTSGSPDTVGEICIRGPGMFEAYLDPWTPARAFLEPDGFRTGDLGWRDADGDLHLAGRRANRISMAGMKFFCEEVEAVLDAHPAVARSRVSARTHAHLGAIPVAEIVPADPAHPPTTAELNAYSSECLASYKIPRRFSVVESLPLTPTGKLVRWRDP